MVAFTVLGAMGVFTAPQASAEVVKEMTPALVDEAIQLGTHEKRVDLPEIMSRSGFAWKSQKPLWGVFSTPFLRVAVAANSAKRKYKPFTASDVTPDLVAPELHVYAFPIAGRGTKVSNVEAVVITKKGGKDRAGAIQPVRTEALSSEFQNLYGAKIEGQGMLAVFPLDALQEGYEVHVVYNSATAVGNIGGCDDCAVEFKLGKIR